MKRQQLLSEFKNRNLFKACTAYFVTAWVVIQILAIILPTFGFDKVVLKSVIILLVLCFPIWFWFSYTYELTPGGLVKRAKLKADTGHNKKATERYNKIILGGIAVIIALLLFNIYRSPSPDAHAAKQETALKVNEDKSIAVLAFADMSPAQDQKYFSEGISEEILNLLTKIPDLKVISRTSSFAFKDKEATTSEIGELLNVNHILDGSIRKSGNNFRISAQLIDAKNGAQLWSETYDRSLDDIFKIQDEIASKIIQQLQVSLMGKVIESKEVNIEAYNLFLEAKLLRSQQNFKSDSLAEATVREAINIDDNYAPSWALLSELIYNGTFSYSRYTIDDAVPLSLAAAQKSIDLDPDNSIGYIAMATLNRALYDFKAADKNLSLARQIDPDNVDVIYEAASYELDIGNLDHAIELLQKAINLDPINYLLYYTLGLHYIWNEEYDKGEKAMQKFLRANPNSGLAYNFLAQIYLKQGKVDEAFAALAKDSDPYWSLYRKSIIYQTLGKEKEADVSLNDFIEKYGHEGWPNIAHVYACRGDKDNAFKWLELAFENKDASLMEILNYPEFKIMHDDPRWNKFIKKLNFPADEKFSQ